MAEQSVSKSAITQGSAVDTIKEKLHSKNHPIDYVFPLYDQIMQKVKLPNWFSTLCDIFLAFQVLTTGFWIFAPAFSRTTGKWKSIYYWIIKIVSFQNPLNFMDYNLDISYVCIGVALFSVIWLIFVIYYHNKVLTIPTSLLYISVLLFDIIAPMFIIPSAYAAAHGISALYVQKDEKLVIEIVLGCISYVICLFFFILGCLLKSRSVIFTNLTYQSYDNTFVIAWFSATSFECILSGICQAFDGWIYIIVVVVHLIPATFVCIRMFYIPFYTLWRNPICFQFGIVTFVLDINLIILTIFSKATYNYTIIVFLASTVLAYPVGQIVFRTLIKRIKNQLTYNDEITDLTEYFDSLGIANNSHKVMMYIVVGMAEICDYFVDGSLIDYIIQRGDGEETMSLLLQVLTYFPSEANKLNQLYRKLISKRKLTFINRFLIYQISMVKTRRLVTNTKETFEIYNKLKAQNDEIKYKIRQFWDKTTCKNDYISDLHESIGQLQNQFNYVLGHNPNNTRITNEYANFLIECVCDFDQAILQTIKSDAIVDGKDFNVDTSFRSFVMKFPDYLKKKIYDPRGRRLVSESSSMKKDGNIMDQSMNSLHSSDSGISSIDHIQSSIDIESEEIIGGKLLRQSRVRILLNRNIKGITPKQSLLVTMGAILTFVAGYFFLIAFFLFQRNELMWRKTSFEDLKNLGYGVLYSHISIFRVLTGWAEQTGRYIENNKILDDVEIDEKLNIQYLVPEILDIPQSIYYALNKSRTHTRQFLDTLIEMRDMANIYNIATQMVVPNNQMVVCSYDGAPAGAIQSSYKNLIYFVNMEENELAGAFATNSKIPNIFNNTEFCQVQMNTNTVHEIAYNQSSSLQSFYKKQTKKSDVKFWIWFLIGMGIMFQICILPITFIIISYLKLASRVMKSLLALPAKAKEEAKLPLTEYNSNSEESDVSVTKVNKSMRRFCVIFISYSSIGLTATCFTLLCVFAMFANKDSQMLLKWYELSIDRMLIASEIGNSAIELILLNGSLQNNLLPVEAIIGRTNGIIQGLKMVHGFLMNGNTAEGIKKSIGYNAELDELQLGQYCTLDHDPDGSHDMYACANLNSQIMTFLSMVNDVIKDPESFGGTLTNSVSMNLLHILEAHLYPNIVRVTDKIAELIQSHYRNRIIVLTIVCAVGLVFNTLISISSLAYKSLINNNYKTLLVLIQHLNPQSIIDSKEIMDFLRRESGNKTTETMPISKSIVYGASESIVITNANGIAEIINPSFTDNLGLKPDQVLGQQFSNFVAMNDQAKIHTQLELLTSGQGSNVWEDHVSLINDSGKPVPFAITMIGMKDNENDTEINSIVFILSNEAEVLKKRADAEQAKAKSEKLLYQILPKDIVVRLNRGEKDITFTIPQATVFFIDIVKFSNYAASLSPSDIMANLSLVFATFDSIVAKYPTITKIKLIGDVYMAAADLFSDPNEVSSKHAEESVRCCLDCVHAMEDINAKLEAHLEVRVGVNSGGPLIGGVLGTDKPTFDIIGDTINVAARLQSTDIPGCVQISQETKQLVEHLDFIMEERGEVYLKGKGSRTTYLVRHPANAKDTTNSFAINMFSGQL